SLTAFAYFLRKSLPRNSRVTLMPLRKGPLAQINSINERLQTLTQPDEMIAYLKSFIDQLQTEPDDLHILLIDDMGIAFTGGNAMLMQAMNELADRLSLVAHENFMIVIADMQSNLKTTQSYSSSFIKLFQQSQTGILFSLEDSDMQWYRANVSPMYKRNLKWLEGRGFFISKGNATYIQCPLVLSDAFSELLSGDGANG
ncbi:MAG: hypothetical protein K0B06_03010, partial [Brevefilum sp.]|nr:hypothetical protein [Brevefilum sp.]